MRPTVLYFFQSIEEANIFECFIVQMDYDGMQDALECVHLLSVYVCIR